MEDKILLCMQFGVELIRFWFGMTVIFGAKTRWVWSVATAYVLFVGVVFISNISIMDAGMIMWGLVFASFAIVIETPLAKDWKWKLYCGFILFYQEELVCIVAKNIIHYYGNMFSKYEMELVNSVFSLIIIILIGFIYKKVKRNIESKRLAMHLRKSMIPMLIFVAFEIMLVVFCLNDIVGNKGNARQQLIGMTLSVLSMISIGLLFAIVSYVKNTNDKIEKMLVMEKQIKQLEVQYYETLLKKEDATRRYRHDMNNHFVCLDELMQHRDIQGARLYIKEMQEYMQHIKNYSFNTGNKMLNALLNYYVTQMDENVVVSVKGRFKKTVAISDTDMCTIFSNLIKNAVEALQYCGQQKGFFSVEIDEGEKFVKVRIKNSMKSDNLELDKEGNFRTTKADKKNHGMGILNVKEAIQLNGGNLQFYVAEKQFCSQVILPMEQKLTDKRVI